MNRLVVAVLAPFAAGLSSWMLTGSPLPMALGIALLALAGVSGASRRAPAGISPAIVFAALAAAAGGFEWWLFREGQAMAVRAQPPGFYHVGFACLWMASSWLMLCRKTGNPGASDRAAAQPGLAGGAVLLGASFGTELYGFSPWQVFPVAALPFAAHAWLAFAPPASTSARPLRFGMTAGVVALGLTAVALGFDGATGRLSDWVERTRGDGVRRSLDGSSRSTSQGQRRLSYSRRLPREIDREFDDRVRLYLRTESPALYRSWRRNPVYLRTSTVSVFESDEVIAPVRIDEWFYDEEDGSLDGAVSLDRRPGREVGGPRYSLFIERRSSTAIPLLADSVNLFTDAVHHYADDWYQLAPPDDAERLHYRVELHRSPSDPDPADRAAPATNLRQPDAPDIYLDLPPSALAARVTRLCGTFDAGDLPADIRAEIARRGSYALAYQTPPDASPIGHFLFGDGGGHCELYAASTVMMLRGAGIPSRLVYGYAGGLADDERRVIAFRDRDSHSWAEILTPEGEWRVFDTTPAGEGRASGPRTRPASVDAVDWDAYADLSAGAEKNESPDGLAFPDFLADGLSFLSRHFLLLTGGGVALGVVAWGFRYRAPRRHGEGSPGCAHGIPTPSPTFLDELAGCGEDLGVRRHRGHTWREFLERIRSQRAVPADIAEAVDYHYGVVYAGRSRESRYERRLRRRIRQWRGDRSSD